MAAVKITTQDITHIIETNDLGAAMMVERLAAAFAHGGVWIPISHEGGDNTDAAAEGPPNLDGEGTASLRWLPAASTTVHVTFSEGDVPEALATIPGYLTI